MHPESLKEVEQKQKDDTQSAAWVSPAVQQKMLQESFEGGKVYLGMDSTIIRY